MTSAITSWYAGTTRQVITTVRNTQGALVDLTGATAALAMVKCLSGEVLLTKSVGDGITLDVPNSVVKVDIDHADTASMIGDHQIQLLITLASGTVLMAYDVIVTIKKNYAQGS